MTVQGNTPLIQCSNDKEHEPHHWAHIIDEQIGYTNPSGWEWAYCEGFPIG